MNNYKIENTSDDKTSKCTQEPNDNVEPEIRGEEEQLEFDFMNDGSLGFDQATLSRLLLGPWVFRF